MKAIYAKNMKSLEKSIEILIADKQKQIETAKKKLKKIKIKTYAGHEYIYVPATGKNIYIAPAIFEPLIKKMYGWVIEELEKEKQTIPEIIKESTIKTKSGVVIVESLPKELLLKLNYNYHLIPQRVLSFTSNISKIPIKRDENAY